MPTHSRPRARRLRAALLAAALVLPAGAAAQTTRGWEVCFTSGVLSCAELHLTTTPNLVDGGSGPVRFGTLFELMLRYTEDAGVVSALQNVVFRFAPDPTWVDAAGPARLVDLAPRGGAPGPFADAWAVNAASAPGDLPESLLIASAEPAAVGLPPRPLPAPTDPPASSYFIGGCGVQAAGGVIDPGIVTGLTTCGAGAAYFASFFSFATLDADRVSAISIDTYRRYPGDGAPLAPFCTVQTDGSGSLGTAVGDFSDFGDVCGVRALASTTAPEPATLALLGAGLVGVAGVARKRRL